MLTSIMGSNGNRELKSKNSPSLLPYKSDTELDRTRLVDALSQLHDLLEEYAPSWYTEQHHEQVTAALDAEKKR